jgi:uncharacterized membrane protein YhaH (DUF805 family)
MLLNAGFSEDKVDEAFTHLKKTSSEIHRHAVAINDFLPPLSKAHTSTYSSHSTAVHHSAQKGLFKGRLRRKDFILGFLFFFAIGYVTLALGATLLAIVYPDIWNYINDVFINDTDMSYIMLVPIILTPITIMMLSLITRRLHNLGMPGSISLLYLSLFILPSTEIDSQSMSALTLVLTVLFIILLAKKGDVHPNAYGSLPESKGSFFKRILNV